MKIGIPVKCQNGHAAVWIVEFRGIDAVNLGVDHVGKCKCPKHEIGQGYFKDGEPFVIGQADAARDVLAERKRQVSVEGRTTQHDDDNENGQMARAAACYALSGACEPSDQNAAVIVDLLWPWGPRWWKPTESRRDLVKAGALILAEIERIDRAAAKEVQS